MEKLELKAQTRPETHVEKLRKQGFIPAIVYGHHAKNQHLAVSYADFEKIFKKAGESTLINLVVDEAGPKNVVVQDVQKHYLNGRFQHVDFYEVSMTEKMKARVHLEFTGVSKAVKEAGGVLLQVVNEVEVECLPADLPHDIEVDISGLNEFGNSVHIKDLQAKVGDKVKIMANPEEVVVKVTAPRDVEAELAEPVVEDISKVEGAAETPKPGAEGAEAEGAEEKPAKEAKPAKE